MPPMVALTLCVIVVTVLLRIEGQGNPTASHALWLPTFWMLICGSRPIAAWFASDQSLTVGSDAAGSPLDRLVLSILILLALLVLSRRKIDWSLILKDNLWLILLYLYLGTSILWSDFPFVSFKRWIKLSGGVVMALVVLSEPRPLEAIESVLRRCGYVLIPFSLVLIKYFPKLGRQYGYWEGQPMYVGVGTQKNGLAVLCVISAFVLIWAALRKWRSGGLHRSKFEPFADALVVAISLFLLRGGPGGSYSATSTGILILGIAFLLILYRNENITRWIAAHLKTVVVALALIYMLIGDSILQPVSSIFGRDESLTGRTNIWRSVLDVASKNPLFGIGYGGFWGLEDEISLTYGVKQAHNGYLEVYLEVGIIGIVMLCAFLLTLCNRLRRELNHVFDWGVFGICFLLMLLLYNYTESAFVETDLMWTTMVFLTFAFSEPCLRGNEV